MGASSGFASVLRHKLAREDIDRPRTAPPRFTPPPQPVIARHASYATYMLHATYRADAYQTTETRRPLAPREREALMRLRELGAALADDFTPSELKRAFRTLALRYHPDRCPDCSSDRAAELAREFRAVRSAFQTLALVLANRPA